MGGAGGFAGLMKGAGGGLGFKNPLQGLNAGQAVGGSVSGMGKGLMSGSFEKAYKGGEGGGYDALMKGAHLDNLRNKVPMTADSVFGGGRRTRGVVDAISSPATGTGPAMQGGQ
jgi:hypothetical protein